MHQEIALVTPRGTVALRQYGPLGLDVTVLMVGGAGGGFDSPAKNLYERLAIELPTLGIGAARVSYRNPRSLISCVQDVLAAIEHLRVHGTNRLILIGHSLGGAVVVNAALEDPDDIAGVVTLATQSSGLDDLPRLSCPILFVHGTDDDILPPACSVGAFRIAPEPRKLELMDGAGHNLDECAEQVYLLLRGWIQDQVTAVESGVAARARPAADPSTASR
jgi:pimeloyl-ACP methyl ester carboxylesterase